jgi:TPR repeat protein
MRRARLCGWLVVWVFCECHAANGQVADDRPTSPAHIEALRAKADRGSAQAQYELGYRHANGLGVGVDKALAFKFFLASAAQGDVRSEYEVSRYYSGLMADRLDLQQAFAYLNKAAEHGHGPAQVALGFVHFNGNSRVPRSLPLAFRWFGKAAENGMVGAQCMLGDFYKAGLGGATQDFAEAIKWYRLAATSKHACAPKAQFELYIGYESGNGVAKDLRTAIEWLTMAAKAGNPKAQHTLARSYQTGYGVHQDLDQARTWLRRSREGVSPHEDHTHDEVHDFSGPRARLLSSPRSGASALASLRCHRINDHANRCAAAPACRPT